jgi:hypothetical protein
MREAGLKPALLADTVGRPKSGEFGSIPIANFLLHVSIQRCLNLSE